jgi:hypothetical protein
MPNEGVTMSDKPELDQVADARRRIAEHAQFPTAYWAVYGVVLVLFAGVPIWLSFAPIGDSYWFTYVIAAIGIGSAVWQTIRRRRSGVYLPKRVGAYPTAYRYRRLAFVLTAVGFLGIWLLVHLDQRTVALIVLVPVAVAIFLAQLKTRSAMQADIEAGRVAL